MLGNDQLWKMATIDFDPPNVFRQNVTTMDIFVCQAHELAGGNTEDHTESYLTWSLAYFVPHLHKVNIPYSKIR